MGVDLDQMYTIVNLNDQPMESWKLKLQGNWNELKGKMKQHYGQLSDDDLAYENGKDDEFLGRVQKKLGKTKEDVIAWIEKL
jgi:uncharacterized protein YjbJ (UPF0337 family)